MTVRRLGLYNSQANASHSIAQVNDPFLVSVVATNTIQEPALIRVWVVPALATQESQYSFITYDIELDPGNTLETHRFALNSLDTVRVRANKTGISFSCSGIPQTGPIPADEIQTQLNDKAPLLSPTLTGTPLAPTANAGTNTTQIATTAFVTTAVSNVINGAPSGLDTLDELAAAINDDPNYHTTITTALGLKANLAGPTFTGTVTLPSTTSIGNVSSTEIGYLDGVTSGLQAQINDKTDKYVVTNAQTGTAYTLQLSDIGKLIELNNASAITLTVPTNALAAFPVGTKIDILQTGAGQVTVSAPGVTVNGNPGLKLSGQWAAASLVKRATDTWVLIGNISA